MKCLAFLSNYRLLSHLRVNYLLLFLFAVGCANDTTGGTPTQDEPAMTQTTISTGSKLLPEGFDVQGHRGARGLKPESTLPAFETALDLGVTTLELDLHLTVDGVVVVWHDPRIDNDKCRLDPTATVDAPDPDSLIHQGSKLMISNLTYQQLRAYRCDRNPEPDRFPEQNAGPTALAGDDYRIVSLSDLFDFVDEYSQSGSKSDAQRENAAVVHYNVETKRVPDEPKVINDGFDGTNPGPFEMAILELIEEKHLVDRVIVQSFDHRSLWAIRSINEDIRLAALIWPGLQAEISDVADKGANIWSPLAASVTSTVVKEAHEAGLTVLPWTVNEPDEMRKLIELGVDGIISDRPDLLLSLR